MTPTNARNNTSNARFGANDSSIAKFRFLVCAPTSDYRFLIFSMLPQQVVEVVLCHQQ